MAQLFATGIYTTIWTLLYEKINFRNYAEINWLYLRIIMVKKIIAWL